MVETWEVASVEVLAVVCKAIITIPSEGQAHHNRTIASTHSAMLHQVVVSTKALVDSKTKVSVGNKTKVITANKKMPSGVCATFDFQRN